MNNDKKAQPQARLDYNKDSGFDALHSGYNTCFADRQSGAKA